MPCPRVTPFVWLTYQPCLDGILVDISKGDREIPNPIENPRVESLAPEVACPPSLLVVGSSEIAQQPSHDIRETFALARSNKEMDMLCEALDYVNPGLFRKQTPQDSETILASPIDFASHNSML
jgi:hypothetical protein